MNDFIEILDKMGPIGVNLIGFLFAYLMYIISRSNEKVIRKKEDEIKILSDVMRFFFHHQEKLSTAAEGINEAERLYAEQPDMLKEATEKAYDTINSDREYFEELNFYETEVARIDDKKLNLLFSRISNAHLPTDIESLQELVESINEFKQYYSLKYKIKKSNAFCQSFLKKLFF